ncbi:U1 snRNP protein [Coemansia javaensis]|uniref:U1 snRNP protein n=1 Tax=Coemansia javaensis TaxID=2761396 RepID=A0A9W8HAS4_9FUNG|nr:U1 snRNP protein [Coemansia javaensis]
MEQPASGSQWAEHTAAGGRTYYYNKVTRATTWEKPDELKTPQERQSVWKEYSKDGRPYWYNTVTKKSTWTRPEEVAASPGRVPDASPQHSGLRVASPAATAAKDAPAADRPPESRSAGALEARRLSSSATDRRSASRASGAEAQRAGRREYRTAEEAEAAFAEMLRRHGVGGDWTWEQALRAVVRDADYRALRTLPERRAAFGRYAGAAREAEEAQRRDRERRQREDLFALLDTLPITEHTRFGRVRQLAGDHAAMRAVPSDAERERLFAAYMDERLQELADERRRCREQAAGAVAEFLADLLAGAKWPDVKPRLLAAFDAQMMPILRADEATRLPMDAQYCFVRDRGRAADPEAGLSVLDLIDAYDQAIAAAERREADRREAERDAAFRRERQNRDAFRALLEERAAQLTPSSTWSEFYPQIKGDPRYIAMLGQAGSTPLELFWDSVELLSDSYYRQRKRLEAAMRDLGFQMRPETPLSAVCDFAAEHCADVPERCLGYIHEQLLIKARRRQEEDAERARRARRRRLDDFRHALHGLDPPLGPDASWDRDRPRVAALPEFRDVGDEAACREVFAAVAERLRERALQQRDARRRSSDARKRSRSRAPADDDSADHHHHHHHRRTRPRPADGDNEREEGAVVVEEGSDLEEGEMVD